MCAYTGARHAVAVSSCTAALHIACLAAGLGPGDTAIVPSLAFAATVNTIAHVGATPRFAEVAAVERPWLSAEAAEAAIEPSTKAIVAMSYGGHPGEVAELAELAERPRPGADRGRRPRQRLLAGRPPRRHLRAGRGAQLLGQQEPRHRRGRHAAHRRRGGREARPQPALARDQRLDLGAPPTPRPPSTRSTRSASTTGSTIRARRWSTPACAASTRTTGAGRRSTPPTGRRLPRRRASPPCSRRPPESAPATACSRSCSRRASTARLSATGWQSAGWRPASTSLRCTAAPATAAGGGAAAHRGLRRARGLAADLPPHGGLAARAGDRGDARGRSGRARAPRRREGGATAVRSPARPRRAVRRREPS